MTPREKFLRQLKKEREIGVDPIFWNLRDSRWKNHGRGPSTRDVREAFSKDFQKLSKQWDIDHP